MSDVLETDRPDLPARSYRARHLDGIVQEMAEGLRASLGSIRAAIETMTEYPDMDEVVRAQFAEIVRQGAVEASARLEASMARYAEAAAAERPLTGVPVATVLHRAADALAVDGEVAVTEPGEVLAIRADRAALVGVMVFFGQRVRHAVQAPLRLSARAAGDYAALELVWEGAAIQPVRLERWLAQSLDATSETPDRTAADVLERHDAEVWARAREPLASLQLLVPRAED